MKKNEKVGTTESPGPKSKKAPFGRSPFEAIDVSFLARWLASKETSTTWEPI
jgi:hypothetical protein